MSRTRLAESLATLEASMVQADHYEGATTLGPVLSVFFDICDEGHLSELSELAPDEVLLKNVQAVVADALGRSLAWVGFMLRVPGLGFAHGGFESGDTNVVYFWFDSRQQGVVAVNLRGTPELLYIRLTLVQGGPGSVAAA